MLKSEKYYVKVVFENVDGKILDVKSTTGVETNNVIAQYSFVNGVNPDDPQDVKGSGYHL